MNRKYDGNQQTDEFVNPYNFVSLGEKCNKNVDALDNITKGELSGTITCTLETLSPLFIPNTTTGQAFPFTNTVIDSSGKKKTTTGKAYDFFSYEDLSEIKDCTGYFVKPIIPGSSIRGAVRSAFETVTNSCLSTCDDKDLTLHRRTTKPKNSYGVLEISKTGYKLFDAEKVMLNTARYHGKPHTCGVELTRIKDNVTINGNVKKTGDIVFVDIKKGNATFATSRGHKTKLHCVANISDNPTTDYWPGILFLGEKFQNKHHDAVFIKGSKSRSITEEDYDRFFKVWEQYQKDTPGSYPNYISLSEIPVYYTTVDYKLYIAPACVSKEVFDAKLSTLLGSYNPCSSAKEKVCPACALFGLVGEENDSGALASRLMFRDASPLEFSEEKSIDFYEEPRQLPILGTPRISATEFYTEDYRETYKVWNYDYGITRDSKKPELFSPKLRGRKHYWHGKSLAPFGENDRADLTAKIRAVKAEKKFIFNISFVRLTRQELDTLLWVLTFGGDADHAHKLGHGKPVGYGSVKYNIRSVTVFELQPDFTMIPRDYRPYYEKAKISKDAVSQYLTLTDYRNAPDNVEYPNGIKGENSGVFQWFSINKGKMNDPEFEQVLAAPDEIIKPIDPSPITTVGMALGTGETQATVRKVKYDDKQLLNQLRNYNPDSRYNSKLPPMVEKFLRDYEKDPGHYQAIYDKIKKKLGK